MLKEFLKDLKPKYFKELSKEDRGWLIFDNQIALIEFYIKKGHKHRQEIDELYSYMTKPQFVKALKQVYKNGEKLDLGFAVIIGDFLDRRHRDLESDMIAEYSEIIKKILKKRLKKISKKTGAPKEFLVDLLVVIPEPELVSNPRFRGIYVNKVARRLYQLTKKQPEGSTFEGYSLPDLEHTHMLFAELFGKENMNDVAVSLLLERKEHLNRFDEDQRTTWNALTVMSLDQIETNKKKEINDILDYYEQRRQFDAKKNNDSARRIQFDQISEEDYPKLVKVFKKRQANDSDED